MTPVSTGREHVCVCVRTLTELVSDSSDDDRDSGELAARKQFLRRVQKHVAVNVRPKLRVDRMVQRKLYSEHRTPFYSFTVIAAI